MTESSPPPPDLPPSAPPPAPLLHAPGGPWRAAAALLQPVVVMALLLALVGGAVLGTLLWLLRSPEGTAWLAARVPGVEVQGPRGALLSDRFEADRVVVRWDGGRQWVAVDGFVGTGLRWTWHPTSGAWAGLAAEQLTARRVEVQTGPPGPRPIVMPRSMQVPLRLHAARAQVDELQIDRLPPMRQVQAERVRLWEPGGREYHAEHVRLDWERARIEGQVSLGALPPYTLQGTLRAQAQDDPPAWTADVQARGPLAGFELSATLQGRAVGRGPAPSLQLQAQVRALEAFPLGALQLATQSLDLSALSARAPRTSLSGRAEIEARSFDGPVAASVALINAEPGRWDQGRVPARRLQARLRSPDADRARLQVESFEVDFAQGATEAGRWQGQADWAGNRLRVTSRIDALRPHLLDTRASAMSLSGPLDFALEGLPSPDPRATTAARPAGLTVSVQTTLDGQVERSPLPVQVKLDATADVRHVVVRELKAHAGSATVSLAADVRRADAGNWLVRSSGVLSDFDPLPWWPGAEGSAWRAGGHRLSGSWSLDLTAPPPPPADQPWLAWAQRLAGSGMVVLQRSQLAGVPLSAQLELGYRTGSGPLPGRLGGELTVGGNRITLDGRGDPLGDGLRDRLQATVDAPTLATLAPLARLLPDTGSWQPRGGSAKGAITVDGRWPSLRTEGQLDLQRLQLGTVDMRRAQARWRLDSAADQPLMLDVDADALTHGGQQIERLTAELRGTLAQHRIDAAVALNGQPPGWLVRTLGLRTARGLQGQLRGEGRWTADGTGGGRWSGQVAELHLGPWAGAGAAVPTGPGSQWARATELRTELRFDGRKGLVEWLSAAGQLRLADALTLRWNEVRVDLSGAVPTYALHADIDPFELAPLLARGQPDMGWGGDLKLGARIDLRVGERVDADFIFERRSGDLHLTEEHVTLPFGLNEVRAVASSHDGHWQLAGAFAGRTLGEAAARLNLRHPPQQRWPDADTPIDGVIEAHVANLGVWSSWVPPGWRLTGRVDTQARVTGRLGAPDYAGEVRASDVAVRNLLMGVDLRQGEALVRLAGARAEIERLTLKGGDGELAIRGHATLDGKPTAHLALKADRFRLLGRIDRQLTASADVQLQLSADAMRAQGKVKVDEGLFDLGRKDAPSLDDDVSIRQAQVPDGQADAATPAAARTRRTQVVAIDVDLGERLRLRGRGLDTTLTGQLKVGAVAGRLTLNGIINAAGGTYAAYGQKLEIERGLVLFSGSPDNPTLDVLALRPDIDVQVGVAITGTLDAPRVRLYANVDMSESDKLSWLVLGRASDGLGRADTALLQRAAVALLAGEGEAPTDTLLRNLGLDQLSLRQSEGDVRETVVSLGKQLSRRWYVGYERGVNATTGTWQLIYRIAQRFTLRAQSGLENSLDLIWVWRLEQDPLIKLRAPSPAKAPVPESAASAPP